MILPERVSAVILDMDGTLHDTCHVFFRSGLPHLAPCPRSSQRCQECRGATNIILIRRPAPNAYGGTSDDQPVPGPSC
jgi:hypothetical protein